MSPSLVALVLSVLSGATWQTFGQASLFIPSHLTFIVLSASVPVIFSLMGRKHGVTPGFLRGGTILLSIAALPMLLANGVYLLSFRSAEGSAGDIGGILVMLLGCVALVGTSIGLTVFSSSTAMRQSAR